MRGSVKKFFSGVYFWIFLVILFLIVSTIVMVVLDINDIRNYLPLTHKYDWLSYIGSIIGGLISLFVLLITLHNERRINKENMIEERKRTCYPFLIPNLKYQNIDLNPDNKSFNLTEYNNDCILLENLSDKNYVNGFMLSFTLNMKSLNDNVPSFFRIKDVRFTISSLKKAKKIISPNIYTKDFSPVIINDVDNIYFPIKFIMGDKRAFDGNGKVNLEITVEYKSVLGVSTTCEYFYDITFYEDKCYDTNKKYIHFEFEERNNRFKHINVDYYE